MQISKIITLAILYGAFLPCQAMVKKLPYSAINFYVLDNHKIEIKLPDSDGKADNNCYIYDHEKKKIYKEWNSDYPPEDEATGIQN